MLGLGSPTLRGRGFNVTTTDTAAPQPGAAREGLLARHPLVFFFTIAYAGTWLVELPYVLSEDGSGLLPFSSPLLTWVLSPASVFLGPFLAAFIMTGITEGRVGIGRLLRRFVLWRGGVGGVLVGPLRLPRVSGLRGVGLTGG